MNQTTQRMDPIDQALLERRLTKSKEDFNIKLGELANKVIEFEQKRGAEDSFTLLLSNFFEMLLELKDLIEGLDAITSALECLQGAIGFIGNTTELIENLLFSYGGKQKNGFFARMKKRRAMKKAVKNHLGSLMSMMDGIYITGELVGGMTGWVKKSTRIMSKKMNQKKGGKKGAPPASTSGIDAAKRYLSAASGDGAGSNTGSSGGNTGSSGGRTSANDDSDL